MNFLSYNNYYQSKFLENMENQGISRYIVLN